MTSIALLTLSYRPDFERFRRLHDSVREHTAEDVMHHVVVPRRDHAIFGELAGPRLKVWRESELLPAGFLPTDTLSSFAAKVPGWPGTLRCSAVNVRHPWPPIRGWVLQQLLKLSACPVLGVDAVIIVDSDVVLVRKLKAGDFHQAGAVRLFEHPGAIAPGMERHVAWTRTAHRLLGLPPPGPAPFPDYIGGIVSWDPGIVADCLKKIEEVSGRSWGTAIGRELHFSEFILYGTYLRHFGTPGELRFVRPATLCHSYWKPSPMSAQDAETFVQSFTDEDVAVHVQSNSGTALELVDDIVKGLSEY